MPPRTARQATGIEEFADLVAARLLAMTRPEAEHLTTEGLARRLKLSPRTVEGWRLQGKGPRYLPVGESATKQTVRYPVAWVEEWEASRGVDPRGTREPQPA